MTDLAALFDFVAPRRRLLVLTGAGCSTDSGIPDYRAVDGSWKRRQPVTIQAFRTQPLTRARYWARSLLGWPRIAAARPNAAHRALAHLEADGRVEMLVTQNVDGLHRAAGSRRTLDLHGRLDRVVCLDCRASIPRAALQTRLQGDNPQWARRSAQYAPDGDADLDGADFDTVHVPSCQRCGGLLKPDVVFFGENAPQARVDTAMAALRAADALLIVGSSLMVWSGFRFARAAAESGLPIAAVNLGRMRADALLTLKLSVRCGEALEALTDALECTTSVSRSDAAGRSRGASADRDPNRAEAPARSDRSPQ